MTTTTHKEHTMPNTIKFNSPNYPNGPFTEYELEAIFADWLNDVEGTVTLLGRYEYNAAEAIKRLDPILYRECYVEWLDTEEFTETDN